MEPIWLGKAFKIQLVKPKKSEKMHKIKLN